MELKQVVVNNGGMSQDLSISKQENKFAFENKNIRIQATDDGTLLSVTNLKNPSKIIDIPCNKIYGSCVTPDYLVIFCSYKGFPIMWEYDCIYRIDLANVNTNNTNNICHTLYKERKNNGTLNFTDSSYFDTLYYEEGENVKKVYWTDGKNTPRVINLVTPKERAGGEFEGYSKNEFEFYPNICNKTRGNNNITAIIPEINVIKNRNITSELPSGIIQYFISYYNLNGAETLIVNSSDLYTIDRSTGGGKEDETGLCAFDIEIPVEGVNTEFDYIRVYSALRTSYNGPLSVHVVGNIKIDKNQDKEKYKITDNGINQEQLQDSYIYFVGGTPFIAKTLTEKDGTIFFGNVSTQNTTVSQELKNIIKDTCFKGEIGKKQFGSWGEFDLTKYIPNTPTTIGSKYTYKLQLDKGASNYKTFKSGEIYRFGIQFQTPQGQWTDVVWIGDLECQKRPQYDEDNQSFKVNDVGFEMPTELRTKLSSENYINYRILIADPENSNGRKIKAQGILCPTMFTPGQRAQNSPYSLPSWIMRPKNGNVAYHHFESIFSSLVEGGEIASFAPEDAYPTPYYNPSIVEGNKSLPCYIVTYVAVSTGNKLLVRMVKVWSKHVENNFYDDNGNEPTSDQYEVLCDYCAPYGGDTNEYDNALRAKAKTGDNNNPYGYYKKDANDGKLVYVQMEISEGDEEKTAPDGAVISWYDALTKEGLPTTFMPGAKLLGNIASGLASSTEPTCSYFNKYVSNNFSTPYYIGEHIEDSFSFNKSKGRLQPAIDLKMFPLYAMNPMWYNRYTGEDSMTHSGSSYNDEDMLKFNEDNIFSTTKKIYKRSFYVNIIINDIQIGGTSSFCTLPEIFRPRCTVDGPTSGDDASVWGGNAENPNDDKSLYKHANENLGGETPYDGIWGYWNNIEAYIQIIPYNDYAIQKEIKKSYNNYYVDESIVTLNSPDVDKVSNDSTNTNLNVIGIVPLDNCNINFDAIVDNFASVLGSIDYSIINTHNSTNFSPIYSDYVYNDIGWKDAEEEGEKELDITTSAVYKTYLFGANNFLGVTSNSELEALEGVTFSTLPGIINKQQFLNQYFSNSSLYFDKDCKYENVLCAKTDESSEGTTLSINKGVGIYKPSYDNLVISEDTSHLYKHEDIIYNKKSFGNTRVKFSTTPHIVINLQDKDDNTHKYLLPHFEEDTDYFRDIADGKPYVWTDKTFSSYENPRGIWQQSYAESCIIGRSIWEEPSDNKNIEISDDYFIPVVYNDESGLEEQIKSELKTILINNYENDDKFRDVLKNYTIVHNVQDHLTTYTLKSNNGPALIVATYIEIRITKLDGKTSAIAVTSEKSYISSFTVDNANSSVRDVTRVFFDTPEEVRDKGTSYTDKAIIYQSYDSESKKSQYFYFVWYNKFIFDTKESLLNYTNFIKYIGAYFPISYESKKLDNIGVPTYKPYLFLGEIYNNIKNEDLYGGTDDTALRTLTWIPASKITPINENISTMEGDTYYQRWDCLKTYPTTVEDVNQIVDITSFMVETHKNLDERTDRNRAAYNLMSRPSNFNLFNEVYNQKNDIFTYTTKWEDLSSENVPNKVIWSMTKNKFGDIDTWTNVNTSDFTTVKYPVTKLVNYNNNVMALTEHSLELINFNSKQLVPSTDNTFIELQNSNKVNGTVKLQVPYGTHNMSTIITEKGLYFIEDNENSIIRLDKETGIKKIGISSMKDWLHNHIVQGTYTAGENNKEPFRLEYDNVHKDIYIINKDSCLIYNELMEEFTSFITYSGEYWLYSYNGNLYAYRLGLNEQGDNIVALYKMYSGTGYNSDFTEDPLEYSVWYKINPGPMSDKVFTNGTIMADCLEASSETLPLNPNEKETPFTKLRVWTEYQDTDEVLLNGILNRTSNLKQKFRYWRFNIPRDKASKYSRDRIRNPWINLQLKGNSTKKMIFHNLSVQYME